MPCVRIATGEWAAGSELKLIEAVQSALVASLRIPHGDRDMVLDLYGENRRIVSARRSERYTRVEIVGIAARSLDAMRAAVQGDCRISRRWRAAQRHAHLLEPPAENWGIKGGVLASEVDIGFKINV